MKTKPNRQQRLVLLELADEFDEALALGDTHRSQCFGYAMNKVHPGSSRAALKAVNDGYTARVAFLSPAEADKLPDGGVKVRAGQIGLPAAKA